MESALAPAVDSLSSATHAVGGALAAPVAALLACVPVAAAAERALLAGAPPRAAVAPVDASVAAAVASARDDRVGGGGGDHDAAAASARAAIAAAALAFACVGERDPAGAVSDARAYASRRLAAVRTAKQHPGHVRWADALDLLLIELRDYVKAAHPDGLKPNPAAPRRASTLTQSQSPTPSPSPSPNRAPYRATGATESPRPSPRPSRAPYRATGATEATPPTRATFSPPRREAVTQRYTPSPTPAYSTPSYAAPSAPPSRHHNSTSAVGSVAGVTRSAPHIADYEQDILGGEATARFVAAARALGAPVDEQAENVVNALRALGDFLRGAATTPKPASQDKLQTLLTPVGTAMGKVSIVAEEASPRDPLFNHLTGVAESIPMLGWVAAESKPVSAISDAAGAGDFYLSKVLMAAKKLDNTAEHQAFVGAYRDVIAAMKAYVKEHHTMAFRWNLGLDAKAGDGGSRRGVSKDYGGEEEETGDAGDDPITAFKAIVDGALAHYVTASAVLGPELKSQASAFAEVWQAEHNFIARAVITPKPAAPDFSPIASTMGKVSEIAQAYPPRGPLVNHLTAVAESVAALGWVAVDSGATSFISDQASAGQFYIDKVKMGAKRSDKADAHLTWTSAIESLFADLKAYVKDFHTVCLQWNSASAPKGRRGGGAQRSRVSSIARNGRAGIDENDTGAYVDPVAAFQAIVIGPLAKFVAASSAVGSELKPLASAFADVWAAEEKFITMSSSTSKPAEPDYSSISSKMGRVSEVAEAYEPRGPFINHVTAVSESVGTLGWVAVDSGAASFVSDQSSAGQFYIDKVKMAAKRSGSPETHLAWAQALESLFEALKAYVKEYHTNALHWNSAAATARRGRAGSAPRGYGYGSADFGGDADQPSQNSLSAFADLVGGPVKSCVDNGIVIGGGGLENQCRNMLSAFKAEYEMLVLVASQKRPTDLVLGELTAPIGAAMWKVSAAVTDIAPREDAYNLMNAMAESIPALGWVATDDKPKDFIPGYIDAGNFYASKALMAARSKPADQLAKVQTFVRSLKEMYSALLDYVRTYQPNGLEWNSGVKPPSRVPF